MAKEKKQKTALPGVLFTVVVILVLAVIILPFIIDGILKASIEKAIKSQLNVPASVSRVHLNLAAGSIEVNDLKIGNPPGYELENILELKSINVKANIRSLASDAVEVNQVSLNDLTVVIVQKDLKNNMADILISMPKKPETDTEKTKPGAKNIHISSLDIQNIDVQAKLLSASEKLDIAQLKISALHLSDIGGKKTTLADVIGRIFNAIADAIATQGSDVLPGDITGPIQENIDQTRKQLIKKSEEIKKETKEVTEKLKGLFKKKD